MAEPMKNHSNSNREQPHNARDEPFSRKGVAKCVSSSLHDDTTFGVESNRQDSNNMISKHQDQYQFNKPICWDVEHLATFSIKTNAIQKLSNFNRETPIDDSLNECTIDRDTNNSEQNRKSGQQESLSQFRRKSNEASVSNPKAALERLFELEKLSGIWTQRMQIELTNDLLKIIDCESNSIVEKFSHNCVTNPEAFNKFNDIYNNILVFVVNQSHQLEQVETKTLSEPQEEQVEQFVLGGEIYIFQCVSHDAQDLVKQIQAWKLKHREKAVNSSHKMQDKQVSVSKSTQQLSTQAHSDQRTQAVSAKNNKAPKSSAQLASNPGSPTSNGSSSSSAGKPLITVGCSTSPADDVPLVNVNVKETVQVFNQIAALREQSHIRHPTDASNGSADNTQTHGGDQKVPLQLYKQRSIRASLGPKHDTNKESAVHSSDRTRLEASYRNSGSSSSSSSGPSFEMRSNKQPARSQHHLGNNRLPSHERLSVDRHVQSNHSQDHFQPQQHQQHQKQQQQHPQHRHHHHRTRRDRDLLASEVGSSSMRHQMYPQSKSASRSQNYQQNPRNSELLPSPNHDDSLPDHLRVSTNESYVSVLNHCFDDIEKFIIRLQEASAAYRELYSSRKSASKRPSQAFVDPNASPMTDSKLAMLTAKARGPNEDDYFEIFSKFKLAFNLLAKLKGCIHDPNAPELVHFLFTPLLIIIESARNVKNPIDPALVGIPFLNQEAIDLLSNCCSSKEFDLWMSLGPNWTLTVDPNFLRASRLPTSFQPVFSDGWAPVIGELDLIGLVIPPNLSPGGDSSLVSDIADMEMSQKSPYSAGGASQRSPRSHMINKGYDSLSYDPQIEWFFELQARGAMIVRVLFSREANNDKELSVRRGEILEVLDDSRRWWRARNIDMEVAFVPHTIVAIMRGYQTLEELLAGTPEE